MYATWHTFVCALLLFSSPGAAVFPYENCEDSKYSTSFGGVNRGWNIHQPSNLDLTRKYPLVLDLVDDVNCPHGNENHTRWKEMADKYGAIVVWPFSAEDSMGERAWDISHEQSRFDAGFLRHVVEEIIENNMLVDATRVYVGGNRKGCAMALTFAKTFPDIVAAVACHTLSKDHVLIGTPMPVIVIQAKANIVSTHTWTTDDEVNQAMKKLVENNGCKEETSQVVNVANNAQGQYDYTITNMTNCEDGALVTLLQPKLGQLTPYAGYNQISGTFVDTTEFAWKFVSQFKRIRRGTPVTSPKQLSTYTGPGAACNEAQIDTIRDVQSVFYVQERTVDFTIGQKACWSFHNPDKGAGVFDAYELISQRCDQSGTAVTASRVRECFPGCMACTAELKPTFTTCQPLSNKTSMNITGLFLECPVQREASWSDVSFYAAIGGGAAAALLIFVAMSICVTRRRKNNKSQSDSTGEKPLPIYNNIYTSL